MPTLVLHIDDQPDLPGGVEQELEREGYGLLQTADPEEAIRVVEERDPILVLMELELAGCDGLDLLEGIRTLAPALPVVALTRAPRDSGLYGEAIASGITDFLCKPVLAKQLLGSVREAAPPPGVESIEAPPGTAEEDRPLPEVLARLHRRGASGVLLVDSGEVRRAVQLRNGYPVAVGASAEAADGAEPALLEGFGWADARLVFAEGRRLGPGTSRELDRDPASLILEGVMQAAPFAPILDWLVKHASLYVSSVPSREDTLDDLELTPAEERWLEALDGEGRLADVLESASEGERLLYGLWVVGRLELHATPTLPLLDEIRADVEETAEEEVVEGGLAVVSEARAEDSLLHRLRELAQRVMTPDDFEALDVPLFAPDGQVQAAYEQRLAEIPEEAVANEDPLLRERARRIRERIEKAYQNLKDPETRRAYALLRSESDPEPGEKASAERALEAEQWFRKGGRLLERKSFDEAAAAFGMASHLDPNEGEYLAHLGYAMYLSNPDQEVVQREAMEHIANAIKRSPKRELSYVYLGRILRGKGELDTARKVFQRALRIAPGCHEALQEIRLMEMREKKSRGILSRLGLR